MGAGDIDDELARRVEADRLHLAGQGTYNSSIHTVPTGGYYGASSAAAAAAASSSGVSRRPAARASLEPEEGGQHESIPLVLEQVTARNQRTRDEAKLEHRFGVKSIRLVDRLMAMLLGCAACLCPRLKRRRVEATNTKADELHVRAVTSYASNWRRCCTFVGIVTLLGGALLVFMMIARFDNSEYLAAREADLLLRRCGGHTDRMRILREPVHRVPADTFKQPYLLPCGTPLEFVLEQLRQLHQEHPADGHRCLTAKHLNHSYAIISLVRADNAVEFVFNPSDYSQIGSDMVPVNETSDFFPRLGTHLRVRPRQAWLTVTDVGGVKERLRKDGATLHCLLAAWEILTSEHYEFWSAAAAAEATEAAGGVYEHEHGDGEAPAAIVNNDGP